VYDDVAVGFDRDCFVVEQDDGLCVLGILRQRRRGGGDEPVRRVGSARRRDATAREERDGQEYGREEIMGGPALPACWPRAG